MRQNMTRKQPLYKVTLFNRWQIILSERQIERIIQKVLGLAVMALGILYVAICVMCSSEYYTEDSGGGLFMIFIGLCALITS